MNVEVEKITNTALAEEACSFTMNAPVNIRNMYKMYKSEHSPIRTQILSVKLYDIPSYVSTHFVRHSIGVQHYVSTRRSDRFAESSASTYCGLTAKALNEIFEYKDGILFWKVVQSNRIKPGDIAGTKQSKGYWSICVNGQSGLRHRIIYLMHTGSLPKYVDHIDGNTHNDRIENLRACTQSMNAANSKIRVTNTSGYRGVVYRKDTNKWMARIKVNYITKQLGCYSSAEEAAQVYDKAALDYFGEFAQLNFPIPNRESKVNHMMIINAQALISMARKRLCYKASESTRIAMEAIVEAIRDVDSDLAEAMVPDCKYRGSCNEFLPCFERRSI